MGRFLSPDYNDYGLDPAPVPWADYTNPQSLNLYAYVRNNPLSRTDDLGHDVQICDNTDTAALSPMMHTRPPSKRRITVG